ncbi:MAG: ATP-binding protein [Rhodocyclaceae bacterium]|nr:ATP-binding protein [Rhodocyclaceae bacterium]
MIRSSNFKLPPMIRLTLWHKALFATLLLFGATAAVLVAAARWNLEQGFQRYTAAVELSHLDRTVTNLEEAYVRNGSWDFLASDPQAWRRLQRPAPPPQAEERPLRRFGRPWGLPGPGPEEGEADIPRTQAPRPERRPPVPDTFNIGPRLALLDAAGHQIAGQADATRAAASRLILYLGKPVGQLTLSASPPASDALESAFLVGQTRNLLIFGGAALVGCLLAAWWLMRRLLQPIRQLAAGARDIAEGHLDTRIPDERGDELGELAADFNSMADQLASTEEARRAWISDASHELRTPLAVLRAEIEALQDGVRQPDEATLARLHQQVLQLGKLVDDLRGTLDARGEAIKLARESLFPVALLLETLEAFRVRLAAAGIIVDTSRCGGRELRVEGDENRLRQVFTNLLENSLRYTNVGGRLRITAGGKADTLFIRIEDSEPAPPPSALPRLFDRLFRAESSRSRSHGGSGLGLAICKALVEAHGGRISATLSELGGLAIQMKLPLEGKPK